MYLMETRREPGFDHPLQDSLYHDLMARSIAFGDAAIPRGIPDPCFDRTPYFRPPGYPYFLAAVYRFFGAGPYAARVANMAVGILSCLVAYLLARRRLGEAVALVFALLMALSWILIGYEAELRSPTLTAFLSLLLIGALAGLAERFRPARALAAGGVFGLYALTAPNVLPFGPAAAAWLAWVGWRGGHRRAMAGVIAAFAAGAALTIAPVTFRNGRVSGDPVLISANGGINLFFGNNERSDGIAASHPEIGSWSCFDYPRLVADLEQRLGEPVSYSEASSHYTQRAMDFARTQPLAFARLTARKALLFWSPFEVASYGDLGVDRGRSRLLRNLPMPFALSFALTLTGCLMFLFRKRWQAPAPPDEDRRKVELFILIASFVLVYAGTASLFIVSGRYRVPLIPFLLLGSAYTAVQFFRLLETRRYTASWLWAVVFAALLGVVSVNYGNYRSRPDAWHQQRALAREWSGDLRGARAELEAAAQLNPSDVELLTNLGRVQAQMGDLPTAIARLRDAVELNPDYPKARLELGKALARGGDFAGAAGHFRRVLEISPRHAPAHVYLGTALLLLGNRAEAADHFREAIRLDPANDNALVCLGNLQLEEKELDPAAESLGEALRVNPSNVGAHLSMARLLAGRGNQAEAVRHYETALRLEPGCEEARRGLEQLAAP